MQHIEFYQAEFRPVKVSLPLGQMLSIVLIVALVLMAYGSYQHWMLNKLQREYESIAALDKKQQDIVTQMTQSVTQMKVSPALAAQADTIRQGIANQERLLAVLRQQTGTHDVSYAAFLQSFMDYHQEGIALQGVGVNNAGTQLTLAGVAADAALLPRYLDRLRQADVLQGVSFSVFELKQEESQGSVRFQVSSRHVGSEKTP